MTEEDTPKDTDNSEELTDISESELVPEKPLSEKNKAKIEKWGVKNPKGRIASVFSLILWSMLLIMLVVKGNWSIDPILMAVLFILLLLLSSVRFIQEWKENGDWLDDDVVESG